MCYSSLLSRWVVVFASLVSFQVLYFSFRDLISSTKCFRSNTKDTRKQIGVKIIKQGNINQNHGQYFS